MKKSAFTLIELLVVIAIIAILAAILFPVFAQAKAAAKKISSVSNVKQNMLAILMYANDSDDLFPVCAVWNNNNNPPIYYSGDGFSPWDWLILPYTKSPQIFLDPQAPGEISWGTGWPSDTPDVIDPEYGYNYAAMCPMTNGSNGSIFACSSSTSLSQPANTVAITAHFGNGEIGGPYDLTYWAGKGTWTTATTIEAPWCSLSPLIACFSDSWGQNTWYSGINPPYISTAAAGEFTGGVSLRAAGQAVVAWVDGHATSNTPGSITKGTNWNPNLQASALVVTDQTQYQWGPYFP